MRKLVLREVPCIFCDVCGIEITNRNKVAGDSVDHKIKWLGSDSGQAYRGTDRITPKWEVCDETTFNSRALGKLKCIDIAYLYTDNKVLRPDDFPIG